jgi:multidrug efflux pump subunit AcrA (membrane-fusion protein)
MGHRSATFVFISGALLLLSPGCNKNQPVQAKQESGPLAVTVGEVATRQIQRSVQSVGTLFAYDEAIVSAEIEGRVDKVNIDLGDKVSEGQVLVHIYDEEQRYLLQQNEAQLHQALERLGLKHENDRVKDSRETPDVRNAQANLFDAEQRHKRTRAMVDQGIGSPADLDAAVARYRAAQAAFDSALNQTRNLIQDVERVRAQLELQRKKLRDTTVRAPFSGYIKDRQATIGQYVRVNTPLLTLVKIDPIRLRLEVPERMAPWIRVGQVADVTMEAYQDRVFKGKIWRIAPTVDQSKRTFLVEALIPNTDAQLKPGSYARAHVPTQKVEEVKLVPASAVYYVLGANKAFVVRDGAIEAREVKIGDRLDRQIEILEGLAEGERVATSQLPRLDTGVKVSIAPARAERTASDESRKAN